MKKLLVIFGLFILTFLILLAFPSNTKAVPGACCFYTGTGCNQAAGETCTGPVSGCDPTAGYSGTCEAPPPQTCADQAPGATCRRDTECLSPIGSPGQYGCTSTWVCCRPAPPSQGTFGCSWQHLPGGSTSFDCLPNIGTMTCVAPLVPDSNYCTGIGQANCASTPQAPCVTPPTGSGGADILCGTDSINTAIGCIPVFDPDSFIGFILRWGIGVAGGTAFLLIIYSGFLIMTSSGDPHRLQAGKELLTAALMGLILLIFSLFLLRLIGVDVLGILPQ